ncbi:MAG: hypothetical protein J7K51_07270 [Thermotogae bacterium]|nr:hypothetical protein [Thermotogota bacterium]
MFISFVLIQVKRTKEKVKTQQPWWIKFVLHNTLYHPLIYRPTTFSLLSLTLSGF